MNQPITWLKVHPLDAPNVVGVWLIPMDHGWWCNSEQLHLPVTQQHWVAVLAANSRIAGGVWPQPPKWGRISTNSRNAILMKSKNLDTSAIFTCLHEPFFQISFTILRNEVLKIWGWGTFGVYPFRDLTLVDYRPVDPVKRRCVSPAHCTLTVCICLLLEGRRWSARQTSANSVDLNLTVNWRCCVVSWRLVMRTWDNWSSRHRSVMSSSVTS